MTDCVVDATVIHLANGDLVSRQLGTLFDRRLRLLEQVTNGSRRLRYNPKLLGEYERLTREVRNDIVELFFIALSEKAFLVKRNTLSRQDYRTANRKCGWPGHDQHLIAAALGGNDPHLVVTERWHIKCAACVLRSFAIHIEDLG
jgi:hypothetical protein